MNNTFSVNLKVVSWEQYFHALYRDRCTQVVEEYNCQTSYGSPNFLETEGKSEDSNYRRTGIEIKEFKNPVEDIKKSLLDFLDSEGIKPKFFHENLQESIEMATIESMEQFANIDFAAIVQLDKNNYMIAPLAKDDVVIKNLDVTRSNIVVFKPFTFVRFTHAGE